VQLGEEADEILRLRQADEKFLHGSMDGELHSICRSFCAVNAQWECKHEGAAEG
jgi:hypothetical protein